MRHITSPLTRFDRTTRSRLAAEVAAAHLLTLPSNGFDSCWVPGPTDAWSALTHGQRRDILQYIDDIPAVLASASLRVVPVNQSNVSALDRETLLVLTAAADTLREQRCAADGPHQPIGRQHAPCAAHLGAPIGERRAVETELGPKLTGWCRLSQLPTLLRTVGLGIATP